MKLLQSILLLVVMPAATSCNFDLGFLNSKGQVKEEKSSDFVGGSICKFLVTVGNKNDGEMNGAEDLKPYELIYQVGVCGDVPGTKKKWAAIATTVVVDSVALKDKMNLLASGDGESAIVAASKDGEFYAIVAGKRIKIGKAQYLRRGYPIELEKNVKLEYRVNDKIYDLSVPRDVPKESKRVWLLVD